MTITINNIEKFVDPKVLERGTSYLTSQSIIEIEEIYQNDFSGIIGGSELYNINIRINESSELLTHECTCPYNTGPICKHKVAVILRIRENRRTGTPFKDGKLTLIKGELKKYNKAELNQLLIILAKSSITARNKILSQLGIRLGEEKDNG